MSQTEGNKVLACAKLDSSQLLIQNLAIRSDSVVLRQSLLPDSKSAREQNKSSLGFTSGFAPKISPPHQTLTIPIVLLL